jgi:hypothetical protein
VDYDGQSSYSDVGSVMYEPDSKEISIYPNPAMSEVTISSSQATTLEISDILGLKMSQQAISEGQSTIDLTDLLSGMLIFVAGDQRYRVLKE